MTHPNKFSTIGLTSADASQPGENRAFLVIYAEAGSGSDDRTRVVSIPDGTTVTVGRSRGNTVWVDSEQVSRTHAKITRAGTVLTVEDCKSRNGTQLNGVTITKTTELNPGDEIAVGPATMMVGLSTGLRSTSTLGTMSHWQQRLEAEVDRSVRYRRPLGVVMLRLPAGDDDFAKTLDEIALDTRLMDCLAEYGPDELCILLPECDAQGTETWARRVIAKASAAGTEVFAGVAVFPQDGTKAGTLVSQARTALRVARSAAGKLAAPPARPDSDTLDIVIQDPQMHRLYALVDKVAHTSLHVLVLGETGVGKELVARALHDRSPRAKKPFLPLDCAAVPETLLESQMFGHERGAFTGADRRHIGYFEAAQGGTLFLDEIGEAPIGVQAKLLRVLQERKLTRVGSTEEIAVDVRVVCATNRDLAEEIAKGRFREDLYYRISAFMLAVPPLRARREDILVLAARFAETFAAELGHESPTITDSAKQLLLAHSWPGNVRELRNAIERAVVLMHNGAIEPEHLPEPLQPFPRLGAPHAAPTAGQVANVRGQVANVERAAIESALAETNGNQTRAARTLGISRRALIYKMEKYGLKPAPKKRD